MFFSPLPAYLLPGKLLVFCRGFTAPLFMTCRVLGFAWLHFAIGKTTCNFGPAWQNAFAASPFFVLLGYSLRIPVHSLARPSLGWP